MRKFHEKDTRKGNEKDGIKIFPPGGTLSHYATAYSMCLLYTICLKIVASFITDVCCVT